MGTSRIYHSYHLDVAQNGSDRICYIILPERLKESEREWLDRMAEEHSASMVVISGLFALWASCRTHLFEGVASVSGSFWYDKFTEWFSTQEYSSSRYYFSLGEKEKDGKNLRLAAVEEETAKIMNTLTCINDNPPYIRHTW